MRVIVHCLCTNVYKIYDLFFRTVSNESLMFQAVVDWGTDLLFDPDAAKRVHQLNPDFKLIVVIRDPVQRLLAQHLVRKAAGLHPDAETQLKDIITHSETGNLKYTHPYLLMGLYSNLLSIWAEYFPMSQILIQSIESLERDPVGTLRKAEEFLGVEHGVKQTDFMLEVSEKRMCPVSLSVKCVSLKIDTEAIETPIIDKLQQFYAPHNKKLFETTGEYFNWE